MIMLPDNSDYQNRYIRLMKPKALRSVLARMPWHPRASDDEWIEKTAERIGPTEADEDHFNTWEPHDAARQAQQVGADSIAESEVEDMLSSEMDDYRRRYDDALRASADPELKALNSAREQIAQSLYNAIDDWNEVAGYQIAEDQKEEPDSPEYASQLVPLSPDFLTSDPEGAKEQLRQHVMGLVMELNDRQEQLADATEGREGYEDYKPDYVPDGLEGVYANAQGDAAFDDWLRKHYNLPDNHLPSFKDSPVRDAKTVSAKRDDSGFSDAREVEGSLPPGVSLGASGYGGKYSRR